MLICYMRSSSYNAHDMCEQRYFAEYVLGLKAPSNLKADKGTITHKILEILAKIKLAIQNNQKLITDDIVGSIDCIYFDINEICEKVFSHYAKLKNQAWTLEDFNDCKKWVMKVLHFNNGVFSPLKMHIISPEQHFDIIIKEPWAAYDYNLNGKKISGQLSLKGTIDLITMPSEGIYEIVDWKTGRRLNWATGEEKTHEKLRKDPQLMMYFLAAHYLYPEIDQILVTINFINDGGPFTLCYTKDDIPDTLEMLRKKFEYIKQTTVPKLDKSWKCTRFCNFGMTSFDKNPIKEFRNSQTCKKGCLMTKCEQLKYEIGRKGIDKVVEEYSANGHDIGFYSNPGEV